MNYSSALFLFPPACRGKRARFILTVGVGKERQAYIGGIEVNNNNNNNIDNYYSFMAIKRQRSLR